MTQSSLAMAVNYYSAVESGDHDAIGSYLHNDVKYVDPLWPVSGKDQVWQAAKGLSSAVKDLEITSIFGTDEQVMLTHECKFRKSGKPLRTAVLMTFADGLIKEIELFYNPSQHMDVCTEVFSGSYPVAAAS